MNAKKTAHPGLKKAHPPTDLGKWKADKKRADGNVSKGADSKGATSVRTEELAVAIRKSSGDMRLEALNQIARTTPQALSALAMPEDLHYRDGGGLSYSSDPNIGVDSFASALVLGADLPTSLPNYGVAIISVGSTAYCTMVDLKRKIAVCSSVDVLGSEASWDSFVADVSIAIATVKELSAKGETFRAVLVKDGQKNLIA